MPPRLGYAAAFLAVLAAALVVASRSLPAAGDYRMAADEGAYFRQATAVRDDGPRAFATLADRYLDDPALQGMPPPIRIGHLALAAAFLSVNPSIRSLSVLSLVCHAALALATFAFVWRLWDPVIGTLAGALVAWSPLGLGIARRALMDGEAALFLVGALFLFTLWLATGRRGAFGAFAALLALAMVVKETAWLFLPFFVAALIVLRVTAMPHVGWRHLLVTALAVPAAAGALFAAAFGAARFVRVEELARSLNAVTPNHYLTAYGSGPWYEYLVAFLLLSPVVALLFFLFCGSYATGGRAHLPTTVALVFFIYGIAVLALVPKNPRVALPLSVIVRMGAAMAIVALRRAAWRRSPAAGALVGALLVATAAASDVTAYARYFGAGGIYDPVTYNLLERERMVPEPANGGRSAAQVADEYLVLSFKYYQARDYPSAVRASQAALAWRPGDGAAYNNIGAAYCEMGRWTEAIAALETALRLDPSSELAKRNLERARAQAGVGNR
jgi:tetratricopeptide (TPR) repeat protein